MGENCTICAPKLSYKPEYIQLSFGKTTILKKGNGMGEKCTICAPS